MKLLVIATLFVGFAKARIEGQLLIDLVKWRHLQVTTVFHCPNEQAESISLARYFHTKHRGIVSFIEPSYCSEREIISSIRSVLVPVGLIVDMSCPGLKSVLHTLSQHGLFNGDRYCWLLFGLASLEANRLLLQGLNVSLSTNAVLVQPIGSTDAGVGARNYGVLDVSGRWTTDTWKLSMVQVGSWNTLNGLEIWDKRNSYQRHTNLGGIDINGVNLMETKSGNQIYNIDRDQDNSAYGSLLWNLFSLTHNFSIVSAEVSNRSNVLQLNLVNYVVEMKQNTFDALQYTVAVGEAETSLLFVHPETYRTQNMCFRPFSTHIWFAIASFMILFGLTLYKIISSERPERQGPTNIHRRSGEGILILVLGIFCQQGFINRAHSYSSRIALFSMLLFTAIMYQYYMSYIVSFLLVVPPKNIKSLNQLSENEFSVAGEQALANEDIFNATADKDLVELFQRQIALNDQGFYNLTEGISLIARGKHAFICDIQEGYKFMKTYLTDMERCAVQKIRLYPVKHLHLAFKKDSPLTEMFRITAQKINGHGLTQYQRKVCFTDEMKCVENEVKMPEVNLDQVSSLFLFLLCAAAGSVGLLLLEILDSKISKNR